MIYLYLIFSLAIYPQIRRRWFYLDSLYPHHAGGVYIGGYSRPSHSIGFGQLHVSHSQSSGDVGHVASIHDPETIVGYCISIASFFSWKVVVSIWFFSSTSRVIGTLELLWSWHGVTFWSLIVNVQNKLLRGKRKKLKLFQINVKKKYSIWSHRV